MEQNTVQKPDCAAITAQARQAAEELLAAAHLRAGDIFVVGCSSSEIVGGHIGKDSSMEAAAAVLAGILPVVSQRNAIFMENEVNGIHVDDAIIQRFEGLDRAAGEELGLEVSVQAAKAAAPYADGFYLMTPFNRVALMERLIARLRTEVTG